MGCIQLGGCCNPPSNPNVPPIFRQPGDNWGLPDPGGRGKYEVIYDLTTVTRTTNGAAFPHRVATWKIGRPFMLNLTKPGGDPGATWLLAIFGDDPVLPTTNFGDVPGLHYIPVGPIVGMRGILDVLIDVRGDDRAQIVKVGSITGIGDIVTGQRITVALGWLVNATGPGAKSIAADGSAIPWNAWFGIRLTTP